MAFSCCLINFYEILGGKWFFAAPTPICDHVESISWFQFKFFLNLQGLKFSLFRYVSNYFIWCLEKSPWWCRWNFVYMGLEQNIRDKIYRQSLMTCIHSFRRSWHENSNHRRGPGAKPQRGLGGQSTFPKNISLQFSEF